MNTMSVNIVIPCQLFLFLIVYLGSPPKSVCIIFTVVYATLVYNPTHSNYRNRLHVQKYFYGNSGYKRLFLQEECSPVLQQWRPRLPVSGSGREAHRFPTRN